MGPKEVLGFYRGKRMAIMVIGVVVIVRVGVVMMVAVAIDVVTVIVDHSGSRARWNDVILTFLFLGMLVGSVEL